MSRSGALPPILKLAQALGTGASGVLTLSIPSSPAYEKLEIEIWGRSDAAATSASIRMAINGDGTAANYDYQYISASNASLLAAENIGASAFLLVGFVPAASGVSASQMGSTAIWIPQYLSTAGHKAIRAQIGGGYDYASGSMLAMSVGASWESMAAITSITFTLSAGNWTTASRATAYGRI